MTWLQWRSLKQPLIHDLQRLAIHADPRLLYFSIAMISLDLFFIAVFVAHRLHGMFAQPTDPRLGREWHIGQDWCYAEMLGYVKLGVIVSVLGVLSERGRRPIYAALALIFATALFDDALRLHEQLGGRISTALGLRYSFIGDLLVWLTAGVGLLTITHAAFVRSRREDRRIGLLLLGGFAVLVCFAGGLDAAHVVVLNQFRSRTVDGFLTVIEDGGEQIVISLIMGLTILVYRDLRSRTLQGHPPAVL